MTGEAAIIAALCDKGGPFALPQHVMLRGVRNKTGMSGGAERYADGLAVSVFPSRGIWFAGIEVKVSRSDWLRELKDAAKSEAIQRFCAYWWIATPPGIVKVEELPQTWGLIEVGEGGKCKRVKAAPELQPEPPSVSFVASVMRSLDANQAAAFNRGRESIVAHYADAEARIREARSAQCVAEQKLATVERDLASIKQSHEDMAAIIDLAGVKGDMWRIRYANATDKAEIARTIGIALSLTEKRDDLARMAADFRACASQIDRVLPMMPDTTTE
jgi:hypothetical protein